jgi:hypothetical protein
MADARHVIEIDDSPVLLRLVEEAQSAGRPIVLRRAGADVARLEPVVAPTKRRRRVITEAAIAASRSAAGGWKGNVDVDQFLKDNAESRRISTRPPVDL